MQARLNMTAEPYELSLLWTLWYIKSAGGLYRMNAFDGGAQVCKHYWMNALDGRGYDSFKMNTTSNSNLKKNY